MPNSSVGPPGIPPAEAPKPGIKRHWLLAILGLTFLFILMPFLFWQATWFGAPLNDAQLDKALADKEQSRDVQHALSQIADRILSTNPAVRDSARRFYPQVIAIAGRGDDDLRLTAAWVMGQDNTYTDFRKELLMLLHDPNPMVRRNAALALIRFGDTSGRAEIRSIFEPYGVTAPQAGKLASRLKPGDTLNPGTLVGQIESGKQSIELRSLVPGTINRWVVANGEAVVAGQPLLLVDSSLSEKWEGLRALYLVGEAQDLPAVDQLARGGDGIPDNLRQQAERTASAIRSRGSGDSPATSPTPEAKSSAEP